MSTIENVERKIRRVEGFGVRFLYREGIDERGDKMGLPSYPYKHAAANDITVETWKQTRFFATYRGYDVDVLDRRRQPVQGNTRLGTVRNSYEV